MQVDIAVEDKSLQTSPREDLQTENENVLATDVVPKLSSDLLSNIVANLPMKIDTDTQGTTTETIKTVEQVSQTSPRNECEDVNSEPYEIHIQTSFVIPDEANISMGKSNIQTNPFVTEVRKTFVIDETQPDFVREVGSSNQKDKKKRSKKKKSTKKSESQPEKVIKSIDDADVEKPSVKEEPTTFATLKITKTTVFETSNLISKEPRPQEPLVTIDKEVITVDISKSPGKEKILRNCKLQTNLIQTFLYSQK